MKELILTLQFLQSHLSGCDFLRSHLLFLDPFLEGFDLSSAIGAESNEFFGG